VTAIDPPPISTAPRPARRLRLVALDLDGTCIDAQLRLHPRIRDAVRATVAGGTLVVIASGRMYRSTLPWAQELRVREPLICYQGAVVRELPQAGDPELDGVPLGRLLSEEGVDAATAASAVRRARTGGWHRQAYISERLVCEEDRPEAHLYAGIARVPIHFVDDLEHAVVQGSTKLVCVVTDPAEADRCESEIGAALGPAARVTRSLPPFVEVVNPRAGKGPALRRLCPGANGELQLTDAIRDLARQGLPVLGVRLAPGERRLDIGSFESYREAVDVVARSEGGEKER